MDRMDLVGTEEVTIIRLKVCEFLSHIITFYFQSVTLFCLVNDAYG